MNVGTADEFGGPGEAGGPDLEKFLFVGMRIEERISLRHFLEEV